MYLGAVSWAASKTVAFTIPGRPRCVIALHAAVFLGCTAGMDPYLTLREAA